MYHGCVCFVSATDENMILSDCLKCKQDTYSVLLCTCSSRDCSPYKFSGSKGISRGLGTGLMRCCLSHSSASLRRISISCCFSRSILFHSCSSRRICSSSRWFVFLFSSSESEDSDILNLGQFGRHFLSNADCKIYLVSETSFMFSHGSN